MSQISSIRRSAKFRALSVSVSSLVLGLSLAGSAMAACTGTAVSITGPSTGAYTGPSYNIDGTNCPVSTTVTSGTAVLLPSWGYLGTVHNNGWVPIIDSSGAITTTSGAAQGGATVGKLNINQGATLVLAGQQSIYGSPYEPLNSVINAAGNVVVENNGGVTGSNQYGLTGNTTITGNLTLEQGANVRVGEYYGTVSGALGSLTTNGGYYGASAINFGATTNVTLQGTATNSALLYMNLSAPAVMGGALSATQQSEVWLHAGTLTVNGANTTANPFVGALQLDAGTTFIAGDSSHTSAVFGDPNHTDGSSLTLNIARTSGTPVTLMGYGTIYATVNNSGVVTPGGTPGVLGNLTVSQYNQTGLGVLNIEVSPTGASQLKVLGTASLGGTLNLKIDSGNYGNQVIQILSANAITGSFSNINTSGSEAAGLAETSTGYYVVTELASNVQVFGHLVSSDLSNVNAFTDTLYDNLQGTYPSKAPKTNLGNGFDVWLQPFGRTAHVASQGYGYNSTAEGVTGGWKHRSSGDLEGRLGISNLNFGLAMSYANETLNTDAEATKSSSQTYDGALYAGFNLQNARIDGMYFFNSYKANVDRNLGASGSILSSPKAKSNGGSLQISNGLYDNLIVPYFRATYTSLDQAAITELGTNLLALKVNEIQKDYFYTDLGIKIHPGATTQIVGLRPEITLALEHNFTFHPGDLVSGQFANLSGSPFTFNWKGDQTTAAIVGINLTSDVTSNLQLFGKLDGRFTSHSENGELRLGGKFVF